MPGRKKTPKSAIIRPIRLNRPGPWQYLDLLPMLTVARNLTRDLPRAAYPLVALVVWRTLQDEQHKRAAAELDAEREAIRRSQPIYVVQPKARKRFILF